MAEEIWANIPGFADMYRVSSIGRVESRHGKHPHKLSPSLSNQGYYRVSLVDANGKQRTKSVHRLMAIAFLGAPNGRVTRHLNDRRTDNRIENLAYGSNRDNSLDAVRNVRFPNQQKTHCKNGHAFSDENTRRANGHRICRTCNLAAVKRYQARRREVGLAR